MIKILDRIVKFNLYSLVFLLPLFFLPFSSEAFEHNKQYLLFFLVSLAFLAWLAKMVFFGREIRFKRSPLDLFILAFTLFAFLSAVFSVNKFSSFFGTYGRFSDGLIGLLCLVVFYFLITNNVVTKDSKEQALGGKEIATSSSQITASKILKVFLSSVFFVVLMSYLSVFGLLEKINQFIHLPQVMRQVIFNPAAGSMEGLAVFLAVVAIFLVGMFSAGQKQENGKKMEKAGIFLLLLTVFFLLIIINFNPAWLVVFISLFLFLVFVLWKRTFKEDINRLLLPILFLFLSFAFLFINTSDIQRLVLGYYLPQEQTIGQGTSWLVGLRSATDNFKLASLGSGIGTWQYSFAKFKPVEINQTEFWQVRFDRSGSHWSETLGTMGFFGFASYLALVAMFFLISYFFLQQNRSGIVFSMAFLALIIGQVFFYQNTVLAFAFWLFLGLSVISWQKPLKEKVISFKDFPEVSLIFSVLLTIFALVILVSYFFGARFYLADANYRDYFTAGDFEKLERAADLNPYQSQYKLALARDYLDRIIIESQKPVGQIDETLLSNNIYSAINFARQATEIAPNRVTAWETMAVIYREIQAVAAGATDWAIKSFERAINLEPVNPALHTELGKVYLFSGETEKAKEKFNKAKELMPDYVDASIQIAFIHELEDNIEEAIKQMEELVSFYPYNIEAIFQLGRFYLNSDRIEEAISQFEWAITLFPNHSNSIYSLGVAYQSKGETERAIASFERVLELNPENENVIQKLEELRMGERMEEEPEEDETEEKIEEEVAEEAELEE